MSDDPYRSAVQKPCVYRSPTTCFVLSDISGIVLEGVVVTIYMKNGAEVERHFLNKETGTANALRRFQEMSDALVEFNSR